MRRCHVEAHSSHGICTGTRLYGRVDRAAVRQPLVRRAVRDRRSGPARRRDRRAPRRYVRDDSTVSAYADVEEINQIALWPQHEIEAYALRAFDCAGGGTPGCRRERRRAGANVIALSAGMRAEVIWLSGAARAVRLGWRRIVATPTGSMTIDSPPQQFAAAMLAEFPSRLPAVDWSTPDAWAARRDRPLAVLRRSRSWPAWVRWKERPIRLAAPCASSRTISPASPSCACGMG